MDTLLKKFSTFRQDRRWLTRKQVLACVPIVNKLKSIPENFWEKIVIARSMWFSQVLVNSDNMDLLRTHVKRVWLFTIYRLGVDNVEKVFVLDKVKPFEIFVEHFGGFSGLKFEIFVDHFGGFGGLNTYMYRKLPKIHEYMVENTKSNARDNPHHIGHTFETKDCTLMPKGGTDFYSIRYAIHYAEHLQQVYVERMCKWYHMLHECAPKGERWDNKLLREIMVLAALDMDKY